VFDPIGESASPHVLLSYEGKSTEDAEDAGAGQNQHEQTGEDQGES
jgi:hypothetical protein